MSEWNEGYFTESTYTYGYYREINPVYQRFCLLAAGFVAPEPNENSAHCELGYGQGISVNIHAAANPGIYFGTDFNPAHAANANELLAASKANAKFFDDSFEQMLERDDLPQFDSISLHGIWSWISTENQKIITEFARRYLKQGGIFYNSYNCFPGWAAASPMRELFVLYDKYAHQSPNTYKRVEEALKFTEELFAANQIYALQVPLVKERFEHTKNLNHDYLAHEYLNRDWICMYFTDVAEILSDAKLDYACTANLTDLFDELNLTQQAREFLNKIENPIMKEQARDYFVNQQFRKDLYIRGVRRLTPEARASRLRNTKYVLLTADEFNLKLDSLMGKVTLLEDIYKPLIEYLREDNYKPKDLNQFIKENPQHLPAVYEVAIIILVHMGHVAPCQSDENIATVKSRCQSLNKYICNRAKFADEIFFLASPVTGGAIQVNKFHQIFALSYSEGKTAAEEIAEDCWQILSSQGKFLTKDGKHLTTPEENIAQLKNFAQNFLDKILPILLVLQMI